MHKLHIQVSTDFRRYPSFSGVGFIFVFMLYICRQDCPTCNTYIYGSWYIAIYPWYIAIYHTCIFHNLIITIVIRNRCTGSACTVQITFIFIGQTRLVFGNRVCTCVTKHSNAFRTFLNWLKNSKRVWHEPKLPISRLLLFANFDL